MKILYLFAHAAKKRKKERKMKCNNLTPKQKDEEAKSPQFWLIGSIGNLLIKEACTKHIT